MTDGKEVRNNLSYTKTHEWVQWEEKTAKVGMTDYAQEQMSELVYAELPVVGKKYQQGEIFAQVESIKTVSAVMCPLDCEVVEINAKLVDEPMIINQSPYEQGWLAVVKPTAERPLLLDPAEYELLLKELAQQ